MFDVLEFLDENDNLAIFLGDEVMVRSQNNICLLCLFKFGIRETRTCRPSFNLKFAGRSLQVNAPDLMMKLVFNLRYNLSTCTYILAVEIRHHDAVQTATAVART